MLKLIVRIKVILDRLFATSCDQYDFSNAGGDGLFDYVFDNGMVVHGYKFFRIALVAGNILVPGPATGITALLIGFFIGLFQWTMTSFDFFHLDLQILNFSLKL